MMCKNTCGRNESGNNQLNKSEPFFFVGFSNKTLIEEYIIVSHYAQTVILHQLLWVRPEIGWAEARMDDSYYLKIQASWASQPGCSASPTYSLDICVEGSSLWLWPARVEIRTEQVAQLYETAKHKHTQRITWPQTWINHQGFLFTWPLAPIIICRHVVLVHWQQPGSGLQ